MLIGGGGEDARVLTDLAAVNRRSRQLGRIFPVTSLGLATIAFLIALAGALYAFQSNIARYLINPRAPFQTVPQPPAPDYQTDAAWLLAPAPRDDGAAANPAAESDAPSPPAIFYVHSTTYFSRDAWNSALNAPKAKALLETTAAPNQAGPFATVGDLFAPRYRQATGYALFTHKYDGVAAQMLAFGDVERAFDAFLERVGNDEAPIVLVGNGQGGLYVLGLLQRRFPEGSELANRLAVAYVIDYPVPGLFFEGSAPGLLVCKSMADTGCVVAYVSEPEGASEDIKRARTRTLAWAPDGALTSVASGGATCVNPLGWTIDGAYQPATRHLGAASATGLMVTETPPTIAKAIGAACVDGVLIVDRPEQDFLRQPRWFGSHWRPKDFNLFYFDLRKDAERRASATAERLFAEAGALDPIGSSIEVEISPVNKVPD